MDGWRRGAHMESALRTRRSGAFVMILAAASFLAACAAVAAAPTGVPGACTTSEDCSLNGVCNSGHCVCDAAWGGAHCTQLQLLPAPAPLNAAYPPASLLNTTTSWGGSVVKDSSNGRYHIFLAEMSNSCGMTTWTTNSLIRHAVSDHPQGPYEKKEIVMPPFAHNPTAIRAPDGTYLIYHIGCGTPIKTPCTDCHAGNTGKSCHAPGETVACNTTTTNILYSKSLDGPWKSINAPFVASPTMGKPYQIDNPSVHFFSNGSLIMAGRGGNPSAEATSDGIITAPSWRGPYTMHTMIGDPHSSPQVEDPFIWRDHRGNFHCIFHKFTDEHPSCGGHAFSRDGFSWTLTNDWAYNTTIFLSDGNSVNFNRRERPHLLFEKAADDALGDGTPVMLFTSLTNWDSSGALGPTGDKAFTFGQAVKTS